MTDRRSPLAQCARRWLLVMVLVLAISLGLSANGPSRGEARPDVWTVLVQQGDVLASGQLTPSLGGQSLTAGKAYLLAFHEAQDAGDPEHVLAVADRLDAAGERDLAAHVRRAAATLLEEIAR